MSKLDKCSSPYIEIIYCHVYLGFLGKFPGEVSSRKEKSWWIFLWIKSVLEMTVAFKIGILKNWGENVLPMISMSKTAEALDLAATCHHTHQGVSAPHILKCGLWACN
jgi:hypothetical protein